MEMIERFMAVMLRIAGLKAVGAYDDILALIDDSLREYLAGAGRGDSAEQLSDYIAGSEIDETVRLRILALLKEKVLALEALHQHAAAAATLRIVYSALYNTTGATTDWEGRRILLSDLHRSAQPAIVDLPLFVLCIAVLTQHGLYAQADDVVFMYSALAVHPQALSTIEQAYNTMLQRSETELTAGNFSRQEVEESLAELRTRATLRNTAAAE